MLRSWNAARLFSTDESAIIELLEKLEHGYLRTNPYHNATHAADVAYTTHVMLRQGVQAALGLSQLQCAVAVLAAAAHDFRHPGIGANYLIAVGDELALTYNDKSPLESFHVSEFFKLLGAPSRELRTCKLFWCQSCSGVVPAALVPAALVPAAALPKPRAALVLQPTSYSEHLPALAAPAIIRPSLCSHTLRAASQRPIPNWISSQSSTRRSVRTCARRPSA